MFKWIISLFLLLTLLFGCAKNEMLQCQFVDMGTNYELLVKEVDDEISYALLLLKLLRIMILKN